MRKILLFHALRTFSPITPFITPFFVEKKQIKNTAFHNKVIPFFFISGFLASLVGPLFVEHFGEKTILIWDTVLDLVFLGCFFVIPNGRVAPLIVITCMHGASSSLGLLTKGMLYAEGGSREKMYSTFNIIKRVSSILSSWIGQDLFYACSEYSPSLVVSIVSTACCLLTAFFLTGTERKAKESFLNTAHMLTRDTFTRNYVFFGVLNIIASTIYISFAFYSASIFIERRKNTNLASNAVGRVLYYVLLPFRALSFLIIKALAPVMQVRYAPKYDQEKLIFGYIDGIAKIVSVLFSTLLTRTNYATRTLAYLCLFLVLCTIVCTFLMGYTSTLISSYLCFIVGATLSNTLLMLTHSGFNKAPHLATLLGVNLTVSSGIHIGISYFSKWKKMGAYHKMYLYLGTSVVLYAVALYVRWSD
ncbi:Major Facilitator Superfamily (MFS) [Trachipleistophora hominis]|uniref:Major Facilitator Superfamily (MFS) n=1 Tax=Trachipleistophora hominis TaxID=72359 RepID=L7JTT6_TRAHO|nr:Major Facilitator Superfamily (MFS) [Trachipleistophora hominis]